MNQRTTLIAGVVLSGLAVALGAFGAHALEAMLTARGRTDTWDLAVQYQIIHGLALLITALLLPQDPKRLKITSSLFLSGVICFSGSLYVLCLSEIIFPLVLITPLGGLLLIGGWSFMLISIMKNYK
ncbi:MAG: DUF423 domain-containing protein [Cyclobacteriaceae bacterium]|jgi:uncharacterized membrane protein YgdD (TMEM256/DUF423 family)